MSSPHPSLLPSCSSQLAELDPATYGLGDRKRDMADTLFPTEGLVHGHTHQQAPLSDIIRHLRTAYCGSLTLESSHIMVGPPSLLHACLWAT